MKCINVYVYRMYIGPITKTHIGLPILNQYTFACWVGDRDNGRQFWPQSGSDLSQNETNQIVQITF